MMKTHLFMKIKKTHEVLQSPSATKNYFWSCNFDMKVTNCLQKMWTKTILYQFEWNLNGWWSRIYFRELISLNVKKTILSTELFLLLSKSFFYTKNRWCFTWWKLCLLSLKVWNEVKLLTSKYFSKTDKNIDNIRWQWRLDSHSIKMTLIYCVICK